ncbi:MAG: hypothetical protein R8K48_01255 [Gallionella sp.]
MKTIYEIGLAHGVHPAQVGFWKKEIQAHAKTVFENRRRPKPLTIPKEPELLYNASITARKSVHKKTGSPNRTTTNGCLRKTIGVCFIVEYAS